MRGCLRLPAKKTVADAWRTFFTPDDNVGIKINPIGGVKFSTQPEVVNAIIRGLTAAGVKENTLLCVTALATISSRLVFP